MRMYLKTVMYLYDMFLKRGGYHEQPLTFKPFYALFVLWVCILLAIPICTAVVKMAEVERVNT